jgi:hypothetical protein
MTNKNEIFALSQDFTDKLYQDFISNPNQSITDFFEFINLNYPFNEDCIVRGKTDIYFDDIVIDELNKIDFDKVKTNQADLHACKLLFEGNGNGPGIYKLDGNGNKIKLSYLNATDPRIWNFLSLFLLRSYTNSRWGTRKDSKRIFLSNLSNERISRHSIARLYWSADLCFEENGTNKLALAEVLWQSEDFMTQVTERSTADNKLQIQWFLKFCSKPENRKKIFEEKSHENKLIYRTLLKLFIADSLIYNFQNMDETQFLNLCKLNLDASRQI